MRLMNSDGMIIDGPSTSTLKNLAAHLVPIIQEDIDAKDNVNHPAHYTQGSIECIDAIKAATVGLEGIEAVLTGNAIKYLWRWKCKGGVEDIDKAIWYLNRLKEELGSDET